LLITLIGVFTRNLIGIALLNLVDRTMQRIPVVKNLFTATKQIAEVFLADRRSAFKQVVMFEYPRRGIYSLGFVTSDNRDDPLLSVFLPTTPNPTSGYMLLVPRSNAQILPIAIEDGVKMIISGGAVSAPPLASFLPTSAARSTAVTDDHRDGELSAHH
jgi:uncharacterized membrane protein